MSKYHDIEWYAKEYEIPEQTIYTWTARGYRGKRLSTFEIGGIKRINESTWYKFSAETKKLRGRRNAE